MEREESSGECVSLHERAFVCDGAASNASPSLLEAAHSLLLCVHVWHRPSVSHRTCGAAVQGAGVGSFTVQMQPTTAAEIPVFAVC